MRYMRYPLFVTVVLLGACSGRDDDAQSAATAGAPAAAKYVVMDDSLTELKDDFNSRVDQVRFIFLVGPTCGICLRGMADLNDAFIEAMQGDARFHVFVVHVPALGAKEEHVAQAIPLLDGPNVTHYWEDSGIIGMHYHDLFEVRAYVWDTWSIYRPGVTWDQTLPPMPDYWEHQLTGAGEVFTADGELDAERFAGVARTMIDKAGEYVLADPGATDATDVDYADGAIIPKVAQPLAVAIGTHIRGRGGYRNLKRIQAINFAGSIESDGVRYALSIQTARPNRITRIVADSSAEHDETGTRFDNDSAPRGLPREIETQLLDVFEFDGPVVEWKDKEHSNRIVGMKKIGKVLAWELELTQAQGQRWQLWIDSHTGSLIQAIPVDGTGTPQFVMRASDFRDVDGFTFPFLVEYKTASGDLIATESFTNIEVKSQAFDIDEEAVTH